MWEELHWRFLEELKEELRKIKRQAGRESMTLQDLKFYALMPDKDGTSRPWNFHRLSISVDQKGGLCRRSCPGSRDVRRECCGR